MSDVDVLTNHHPSVTVCFHSSDSTRCTKKINYSKATASDHAVIKLLTVD
jgi:hypothetical protein